MNYAQILDQAAEAVATGKRVTLGFASKADRERCRAALFSALRREKLKAQRLPLADPCYDVSPWDGIAVMRDGDRGLVLGPLPVPVSVQIVEEVKK